VLQIQEVISVSAQQFGRVLGALGASENGSIDRSHISAYKTHTLPHRINNWSSMSKQILVFTAACLMLSLLCGCSVKNTKVTDENSDQIIANVQKSHDLTGEEYDLFKAAMLRYAMSGQKLQGASVGQLIQEQREINAKLEQARKEADQRAKNLAAEAAAKEAEMRNLLSVAVTSIGVDRSGFIRATAVSYIYQNQSAKDIRAFEGSLEFKDVLGNKLEDVRLKVLKPVKAGAQGRFSERYYAQYYSLTDKSVEDLRTEWHPTKILFADGSEQSLN
jgi:hypothetical protein